MSISSIGISYSQLQQSSSGSSIQIKGIDSSESEKGSEVKSSGSMDTVSLTSEASQSYEIGGESVSKAEFDKYDTDGDGEISSSEQAAYEADQTEETTEEDTQAALLEAMQETEEDDAETDSSYSPYGSISLRSDSGSIVNATA